ncbi:U3 small nucleolar RNA-associated protein 6-like protein [Dinothrombium tinctorium]|uniref:U3 small nucleolar RNA-associated protein 6-like protein n=1 Tax=Dinothrombium tinctorium TaxID=1965070 RepID=A0A443RLJ4_9ACAR|nr:U3 small nucleolar RNA-associated protein 6-like protein [Dinothrombium tinctorium]
MAEIVEYRIEKGIDFFEQLERNGIFDRNEVKAIIKKRKEFEYKLQRKKKSKHHFLKYIVYEQSLLKLIQKRRVRVGYYGNFKEIERFLSKKIKSLFRRALDKYQSDTQLWFSFIAFCKEMKLDEDVGAIFGRMLQLHSHDASVWIAAAKWHFEENNSPDIARELLLRALRHIPDFSLLWTEYFRMELMYISLIEKRRLILEDGNQPLKRKRANISEEEISNDPVLSGKIAFAVIGNAVKAKPDDIDLLTSFLTVVDDFDSKMKVKMKDHIFQIMTQKFKDKEETWQALAKRYFDKVYFNSCVKRQKIDDKLSKLEHAKETFENGLTVIKTEKMWSLYIKFFLDLLSNPAEDTETILQTVLSLMERAWNEKLLNFNLFNEWLLLLYEDKENDRTLMDLIRKGTERWSSNATVWYTCLSILMRKDSSFKLEIKKLFERAIKRLETVPDSNEDEQEDDNFSVTSKTLLDLWTLYINWASNSLPVPDLINTIEKASVCSSTLGTNSSRNREISSFLKPQLLEKSAELCDKGITKARNLYEKYKSMHPIVPSFFAKMVELEMKENPRKPSRIRAVFNDYIEFFGETDSSIWLDFIKFESTNNKPENVAKIYFNACKRLKNEECDKFVSAYALLQTGDLEVNEINK